MNTQQWNEQDEQLLKTLFERGMSDKQIADVLKRTDRAIEHKRRTMGLARDSEIHTKSSDSSPAVVDAINRNSHRILIDLDDITGKLGRIADALELMALSDDTSSQEEADTSPLA